MKQLTNRGKRLLVGCAGFLMVAACLLALPGPARSEGSADFGPSYGLLRSTRLLVYVASIGTETIYWNGTGSVFISKEGTPSAEIELLPGNTTSVSSGTGRYRVRLQTDQPIGSAWTLEVRSSGSPVVGRVSSRNWKLVGDSFMQVDAINRIFYALVTSGSSVQTSVIEIHVDGLSGGTFSFVANEIGVVGTLSGNSVPIAGNIIADGYPIYLYPPFEASYTSTYPNLLSSPTVSGGEAGCNKIGPDANEAWIRFFSSADTSARLICDLDMDGEYNVLGQGDLSLGFIAHTLLSNPTIDQVKWDGFVDGAPTPTGLYNCVIDLNLAEMHYVTADAETGYTGIRLFQRAAGGTLSPLQMYWDDSLIQNLAVPAMPNGLVSPVTSGPDGLSSGVPGDPSVAYNPGDGTGNARAWGDFSGAGKGDGNYLDTFTNLGIMRSNPFTIDIIDGTVDTDGDMLRDVVEYCDLGTNPDEIDSDFDGGDDYLETNGGFRIHSDSDNIIDALDIDSDGDSRLDIDEGHTIDTDGDGDLDFRDIDDDNDMVDTAIELLPAFMTNPIDPDTDGDGIGDYIETGMGGNPFDIDMDGLPAARDLDSDGDSLNDNDPNEGLADTDQDSVPNYLDSDDDNDGIDTIDELTITFTDPYNADSDGDGLVDIIEARPGPGQPVQYIDTDMDGDVDAWDLDSDDDGVPDGTNIFYDDTDTNSDPQSDNKPDFRDTDDDADGIPTSTEFNDTIALALSYDLDGDGRVNWKDQESDGDGIPDSVEGTGDDDMDGIPNYLDNDTPPDADGDGLPDAVEISLGTNPNLADSDLDTISDFIETNNGLPIDTDNDGIIDALDTDSDKDTVLDADPRERNADTDMDGIPNFRDPDDDGDTVDTQCEELFGVASPYNADTDGDTITDDVELDDDCSPVDTDDDMLDDVIDPDSDGDSILDIDEGLVDTDMDGIPNFRDDDDDDDGISTLEEATLGAIHGLDNDLDMIPPWLDLDSDGDLNSDMVEGTGDVDMDMIPNFLDSDDGGGPGGDLDGDGVTNGDEMLLGTDPLDPDSDGDGINDFIETDGGMAINTDGMDLIDALDTDSDNDGVLDEVEGTTDTDMDTIPDFRDTDDDGDMLSTLAEGTADFDNDMIPNYLDPDDDDDGVPSLIEVTVTGTSAYDTDSDDDLINDYIETDGGFAINTDGTGMIDALDSDSDDDFIPDFIEGGSADTDMDGIPNFRDNDDDGDTLLTQTEGVGDPDADMIPNYLDDDDDGDGVLTRDEILVTGTDHLDTDSDGDMIDDFVETDGGLPIDTDGDGTVDALDTDSDGDSVFDIVEGATTDTDLDLIPDYRDDDDDGDGVLSLRENAIGTNRLDPDSDGDGIDDFIETDGGFAVNTDEFFPNGDAVIDALDLDTDGDTLTDAVEGTDDLDGDGIPNFRDLDSDGDGILDNVDTNQNAAGGTEYLSGGSVACTLSPVATAGAGQFLWLYLSACAGMIIRIRNRRR